MPHCQAWVSILSRQKKASRNPPEAYPEAHPEKPPPSDRGEFYTAAEAAKVLSMTPRRVRALAAEGKIEGERTEAGWMLFRRSVHSFRDTRRPAEAAERPQDAREWIERAQDLQRQLGRLEGRLEIEAVARSTLEEQLQRERERADRLEEELRERRRGFWRRLFGG